MKLVKFVFVCFILVNNYSNAMMKPIDINSELPQGFEKKMFPELVECAEKASVQNFSAASSALCRVKAACLGLFESEFFGDENSTESKLKAHFDKVQKAYNEGIYDKKYTINEFVKATLLGEFYFEYNALLEKLTSVLKLIKNVDTQNSSKSFEQIVQTLNSSIEQL